MKLWRISNYADLSGVGGTKVGGRWHNKGVPIVYLAESAALAMLEILVNFEMSADEIPDKYRLLEINCPDPSLVSELDRKVLTDDWRRQKMMTQNIGDQWLASMSSCLLKVPSVIVPHSYNFLFNPRHSSANKLTIDSIKAHPYDPRLLG